MNPLRILLAVLAFLGFGALIGWLIWDHQQKKGASYKSVEAKVVSSSVEQNRPKKGRTTYQPVICYQYKVDEQQSEYCADHSTTFGSRAEADRFLEQHPTDSTITVYVSEDDPTKSRLHENISFPWMWIAVASVAMIVVIMLALFGQSVPSGYYPMPRKYSMFSLF